MASESELLTTILEILVEDFGLSAGSLSAETLLIEDLDFDSLDAFDLALRLEEETGLSLPDEGFASLRTLGDIVARLRSQPALDGPRVHGAAQ